MNNTTVTALLISPVMAVCKKIHVNPSKILMPLAFASIIGGTCTLIGTSTNIAVASYLENAGIIKLRLFDFTVVGIILVVVSFIYLMTIGKWLLPLRTDSESEFNYEERDYISEIRILENSKLIGQSIPESGLVASGLEVITIIRGNRRKYFIDELTFEEKDMVIVSGNINDLLALKDKNDIEIVADSLHDDEKSVQKLQLIELLIPAHSRLLGQTIKEVGFLNNFGVTVLAVHRAGNKFTRKIGTVALAVGDLLLVQGAREDLKNFHDKHNLIILEEYQTNPNRLRKGYIVTALFIAAILVNAFNLLPLSICFLIAAVVTIIMKIVSPEEVYSYVDWRLLILIGGMSAFGTAMINSGADIYVSHLIIDWFQPLGNTGILAGFMILTVLLTQPMSNAASALVVLPVAMQSASLLEVNQITFAIAIMLSASVSMITPFEPASILVYTPGKYKFYDFLRVGGLLTFILMIVIYFAVLAMWPL